MDFSLDEDQLSLQAMVRQFCRTRWPLDHVHERPTKGLDIEAWRQLSEIGALSLLAMESNGGSGLGVVEGAVVFEQLGQHLVPGPVLWTALAATLIPDVARGVRIAGGVEDRGQRPLHVEHADVIDTLIVLRADGVARVDRDAFPAWRLADSLDPLRPVALFESLPAGVPIGDAAAAARVSQVGTVLSAAVQLGVATAALDVAVAYSLQRQQFEVPIASFQALKHMMADMYVRVGLAKSATYAAAAVLDDPSVGDAARSIAAAKLLAGEAAIDNSRAAVQVLGGMGFTWDTPPNFLLKRAWVTDHSFGTATSHALSLAAMVSAEAT